MKNKTKEELNAAFEEIESFDFSVAVIGLAGRFPGAKSITEFWNNLVEEKESISFFSDEELRSSQVHEDLIQNPSYVRARGVLGETEYFDAGFFGYSPREAELLDPQHRVFLECAYHALEDAGVDSFITKQKIGVFAGTGTPWYHFEITKKASLQELYNGMSIIIANEKDYLATRTAYKLNLTGTSVSVQSACSTSLTAIVLGIQSLQMQENDLVLAGGVSILFPEKQGYLYEKGGLDSIDGHCRTFDAKAQGTVFSSGAGVVVLKRLRDAIRDNDNILCIIKGGSINNDGQSKVSYTAPGISGQLAVETDVLELAKIDPETISYVEAHGTATQIGDPIEIKALTQTFRQYTKKSNFCAIGSVKTNIGHTDVASGVIGLIKVILSLKHQILPASLHFETPNPQIDFDHSPFYVNVKTKKWETLDGIPRRAMINSFGVGGANACIIVEEAPLPKAALSQRPHFLLPLCAKTEMALDAISSNILNYVKDHEEISLADLAYTLQVRRTLFEKRKVLCFSDRKQLLSRLSSSSDPNVFTIDCQDKDQEVIFMFPGQGNQFYGMGKDLYKEPFFRSEVDKCLEVLNKLKYEFDLRKLIFSPTDEKTGEDIDQTIVAQPALFIIEYALAKFLMFLNISPKALIGHSIGEFVAACIAGVFSLEDALMIAIERARITQKLPKGSMLAIFLEKEKLSGFIQYPNEISVINSPKLTVVSGPSDSINALENAITQQKIVCKKLSTSHAFHSHMMDPLIQPLQEIMAKVPLAAPKIPIMSTVTGNWMTPKEALNPSFWAEHARRPVNFSEAAQNLLKEDHTFFLEVGPNHSLESAVKNCAGSIKIKIIGLMGSAHDSDEQYFSRALGKIWAFGAKINLEHLFHEEQREKISLPPYPFERKKFLLDFFQNVQKETKKQGKIEDIAHWFSLPSWKKSPSLLDITDIAMPTDRDSWVVFHHGDALALQLIHNLKNNNQIVYSVQIAHAYQQVDAFTYSLPLGSGEGYMQLFKKVKENIVGKCRILHLWNFAPSPENLTNLESIQAMQNLSFYSLLFLDQALIKYNLVENLSLTVVGNNIYNICADKVNIAKALMIGPCRVFKNEYPQIQSRLIDASFPSTKEEEQKLIEVLLAENLYRSDEIVVAYRNLCRWLPIYEPLSVAPNENKKRSLRKEGVYIITGGLGAIGLNLAQFIAQTTKANIFLIQRSSFLARKDWDSWLSQHAEDNATSKKIKAIKAIEALGASVYIESGDVAIYSDMEQIFKKITSVFPKIHGVFHCAGLPSGGIIPLKEPEKATEILKPKVQGTLILDKILQNQQLDFFIVFSSITGILGEEGQIDYCSANAFLDAFVQNKNALNIGTVYSSINWGAWDEIGMAIKAKAKEEPKESLLPPKERLKLIVSNDKEQIYQVHLDPQKDWVVYSHKVKNIPTLVGTAFVEFILEFAQKKQPQAAWVISNMQFISPLMFFPEMPRILKLKIEQSSSTIKFSFFSQRDGALEDQGGQQHLSGEISFAKREEKKLDREKLAIQMHDDPNFRQIQDKISESLLWLGERWQSIQKVLAGKNEWLAKLRLSSVYEQEIKDFIVYPALLDFASSYCVPYVVEEFYLPYFYEKMTVFFPLEGEIFSYGRLKEKGKDTISLNYVICNKEGKILVEIEGYTMQKVSQGASIPNEPLSKKSKNILPLEGIEAFKRFFYQLTSPQIVICSQDFIELLKENQPMGEKKEKAKKTSVQHARPSLFTPYQKPSNKIEEAVAEIWEGILGINELGIDDNFIELGGNSLTAIQVCGQVAETFKIDLSIEMFLKEPTIRKVSDYIINQLINMMDENEINSIISAGD